MSIGLDALTSGCTAEIVSLEQNGSIAGRLAALGFVPGRQITMVQNFGHGPLIVAVINTRVALGRREATSIRIRR
jgi:Fe2+ transport system protein FeoA